MIFRKTVLGMIALPLAIAGAPASAANHDLLNREPAQVERVALLGGLFGRDHQARQPAQQPNVQLAQAGDPRVTALEEQVRNLNGKLEELNFLILQMQEQLRKQQEDNEFRFQELEGGQSGGAKAGTNKRSENLAPQGGQQADTSTAGIPPAAQQPSVVSPSAGSGSSVATLPPASGDQQSAAATQNNGQNNGLPGVEGAPRSLGSIRFDANGNLVGGTVDEPVDLLSGTQQSLPNSAPATQDNTTVAALPQTDDPEELYRNSYEFVLSRDYKSAEAGFRSYIDRFPQGNRVADANFWLGESLAGQNRNRDAAEVFLAASRDYPDSKKAPDTLLKLGTSLVALNQKEVACATFREVGTRYPKASDALKERVRQQIAANGC